MITTSLLFGLLHGLWLDSNLSFYVEIVALQNAAVIGFIFACIANQSVWIGRLAFLFPRMM